MAMEQLVCNLAPSERIDRAQKATELMGEYSQKEAKAKAEAAARSAELKGVRADMEESARASREGWEYRDVEVRERPSRTERVVEVIRCDTEEVIRTRPMTKEESDRWRQPSLIPS